MSPSDADRSSPRKGEAAASFALMVASTVAAGASMAALQFGHQRDTFQWSLLDLSFLDSAELGATILSTCLWALAPGLCIASLLLIARKTRAAWALGTFSSAAVLFWLMIDLRVDMVTGNHALDYLRFLGGEEPWQWAGGASQVVIPMLLLGGAAAAAGLVMMGVGRWLALRMASRGGQSAVIAGAAALFYACLMFGPVLAAGSARRPLLLMRLREALPLEVPSVRIGGSWGSGQAALVDDLNRRLAEIYPRYAADLSRGRPASDTTIEPARTPPPNVILIVLESFRRDSISPRWMPRVDAFATRYGLRSERHYSTSHASHLGLFSLLYGRSPLVYENSLNAKVSAQLTYSLRRSGYRASLLTSSALDWQRMDEFLSPRNFDEIVVEQRGRWPYRDHLTLDALKQRIEAPSTQPTLAVVFLMSTHYNYKYPPDFEIYKPVVEYGVLSWSQLLRGKGVGPEYRQGLLNRYRNALAFLDDRLGDFLEGLDLERNIVLMTGDHGESFYDDGRWLHGSRLSDAQLGVPFWIAGPGIEPGVLTGPTSHLDVVPTLLHAVAGKPVPVVRSSGHDLLGPDAPGSDAELLLVGMGIEYRHLLLIRGQERMHLRLDLAGQELQTLGFLDEKGGYLPEQQQSKHDPLAWLDAVDRELGKIAQ